MKLVVEHILSLILIVLIVPIFASANLAEDDLADSDEWQIFKDLPYVDVFTPKEDVKLSEFCPENTMDQSVDLDEYSNANSGCAYYVDDEIEGYDTKTLYFFGYRNLDLEGKDGVKKYYWANTGIDISKSPFEEAAASCKKIVFDESVSNIKPVSCCYWFYRFVECEKIDGLECLDTSQVENMSHMFYCFAYNGLEPPTLNVSNLDTSSVENMLLMFAKFAYNAQSAPILDVSNWDTSNVKDMASMFIDFAYSAQFPPTLDVSKWNTSGVTNMSYMFYYFAYNAQSAPILDVSNWDTSNVKDMSRMFSRFSYSAQNPLTLDLSNWNTSSVANSWSMFSNISANSVKPATIYASKNFVLNKGVDSNAMFLRANIQGGAGTTYDPDRIDNVGACIDILDGEWGLSKGYFTGDMAAVEFYANGAEGALPVTAMYALNSEFVLPDKGELTHPDGLNFAGWAIGGVSGEIKQPGDIITINKYTSIYAIWENEVYSVVLYTNGGTIAEGCDVSSYVYGVGIRLPSIGEIFKVGHSFIGWFGNKELSGEPVTLISKTDIGNKEYWAKWEAITYKISFNGNTPVGGSVIDVPGPVDATYGAELPALSAVPKCQGYKFDGFYYKQGEIEKQYYQADGNPVDGVTWDIASDTELLAYWTPCKYKVSFNGNAPAGSSVIDVPDPVDATYGGKLPALAKVPKCQGYKFEGFYYREGEIEKQYYQADGNPAERITWDIASDTELLAYWTPCKYKVSFNGNAPAGSSVIDVPGPVDATYGGKLPALAKVPKCQGYKFDGFYYREGEIEKQYYQADGNPVDGITWDIASDVELIAKWLPFDDPTNSNECLYDSENITETGDYNTCLPALVFFNTLLLITLTILLVSSLFSCLKNLRNF